MKAVALTQRDRIATTTTGVRASQRRETTGSQETEAAALYAAPRRPDDYDQLVRYRQGCDEAVAAAQGKLAEIDAAWRDPLRALPSFFKVGPEAKDISFERYARKLRPLLQYQVDLARWEATKICMRCATTFVDAAFKLPKSPPVKFSFAGQERRCPHCASYFWKDPNAVAVHREQLAVRDLTWAQKQLRDSEVAELAQASKGPPSGLWGKISSFLGSSEMSVAHARTALTKAEHAHKREMLAAAALRESVAGKTGMRWCVSCERVYLGVSS
ncbi:hypothetical protein ASF77_10800 [Massilia sp. Leaf139]|nr:hypothetical protein ASF77_10800 [Massilia sp. Leaf139]